MKFIDQLKSVDACSDAIKWAQDHPSARKAWNACPRGDWLLWILGRTINCEPWTDGRKPLLACALDCAETVKHLRPKTQAGKIADSVNVLREWIAGKATVEAAKEARRQIYTAGFRNLAFAAASDAAATSFAAFVAAAAHANAFAAASDARTASLKQAADIVRRHYPRPPKIKPA